MRCFCLLSLALMYVGCLFGSCLSVLMYLLSSKKPANFNFSLSVPQESPLVCCILGVFYFFVWFCVVFLHLAFLIRATSERGSPYRHSSNGVLSEYSHRRHASHNVLKSDILTQHVVPAQHDHSHSSSNSLRASRRDFSIKPSTFSCSFTLLHVCFCFLVLGGHSSFHEGNLK